MDEYRLGRALRPDDRYASIGTGWPMIIDEKDILSDLPASDEAYDLSRPEETQSLNDVTLHTGPGKLTSFGGVILLAYLFGKNLIHLHRPNEDDRDHDLNGEFWKRHRHMDNILLNVSLCMPSALKLPQGLGNPNVVFTNMCIHTSTICLHQAAIFKADTNNLPASVGTECKMRCITAAHEIASIMRMASHLDLDRMNPFISFCLYVAARVFVQFLKSRPDDGQVADSLRFLLSAMNALKRRNPLTESFVVQLDVDLEALVAKVPKLKNAFQRSADGHSSRAHMNPGTGLGTSTTHRQECQFLRTLEDDGNPANAPNLVEPVDLHDPLVQLPGSSRNTAPDWSPAEQRNPNPPAGGQHGSGPRTDGLPFATSLHGMMPNNISLPPNYHTHPPLDTDTGGSSNGVPLSTPSPNSNQPTPNSTAAATSTAMETPTDPAAAIGFFLDPTIFGMPGGVGIAPGNNTTNPGLARTGSDHQHQPHNHQHTTGSDPNNGNHACMGPGVGVVGAGVGMGMNICGGDGDGMTPDSMLRSIMAMGNMEGIEGMEGCGMDLGWGDGGTGHGHGHCGGSL
ncbi:hypothetical protein N0V85_000072 [Neurospora sp. IMI 360204]|nr:hypothetical protein N0V85_000072 [Neurospora sp. IMI 360204]